MLSRVVPGQAPRVRIVVRVVVEVEGHLRHAVPVLREDGLHGAVLLRRVTFPQVRIAEPVPVPVAHQRAQRGLVGEDVALERLGCVRVQVHVRVRMVAERMPRRAPQPQHLSILRPIVDLLRVDESVRRRRVVLLQRLEDALRDINARDTLRQRPMGGKIVERQRYTGPRGRTARRQDLSDKTQNQGVADGDHGGRDCTTPTVDRRLSTATVESD